MRRSFALLLAAGLLMAAARAGEDPVDQQIVAVNAARARAEIAQRKARALFQNSQNYASAWQRIEDLHNRIMPVLGGKVEHERAKPDMDRSQELIQVLEANVNACEQDYHDLQRVHETHAATFQHTAERFSMLNELMEDFQGRQPTWLRAGLDLNTLATAYDQVAKSLDEVRAQGEKLIAEAQEYVKPWEAKLKEVTEPPPGAGKKDGPQF